MQSSLLSSWAFLVWRFATLSKLGRLSMVVQQKVERQRSEKPGISSNYISPLTIRDNQPGESFSLAKCLQQKVFLLLSMMVIISLYLEKTPPYYAPSPSPPSWALIKAAPCKHLSYLPCYLLCKQHPSQNPHYPTLLLSPLDLANLWNPFTRIRIIMGEIQLHKNSNFKLF